MVAPQRPRPYRYLETRRPYETFWAWNVRMTFYRRYRQTLPGETTLQYLLRTKCLSKRAYFDRASARAMLAQLYNHDGFDRLMDYFCPFCHHYHLGKARVSVTAERAEDEEREIRLAQLCQACGWRHPAPFPHDGLSDDNADYYLGLQRLQD